MGMGILRLTTTHGDGGRTNARDKMCRTYVRDHMAINSLSMRAVEADLFLGIVLPAASYLFD